MECEIASCENEPVGLWPEGDGSVGYCETHSPPNDIAIELFGGSSGGMGGTMLDEYIDLGGLVKE